MTRKTLGLTGTRKKDPKPVATETEAKVEVESEADPQKRFLNAVAINPAPGIRLELGSEQLTVRRTAPVQYPAGLRPPVRFPEAGVFSRPRWPDVQLRGRKLPGRRGRFVLASSWVPHRADETAG